MALKFDRPLSDQSATSREASHSYITLMYVFNGLGTRGVLMAPSAFIVGLYDFIDLKKQLPDAVAINRFESYFCNPKKTYV